MWAYEIYANGTNNLLLRDKGFETEEEAELQAKMDMKVWNIKNAFIRTLQVLDSSEESMTKEIKIFYHNPDLERIKIIPNGDWIDLRAAEHVELHAGEHKLISLGVSMKLPDGYEAHVAPRSSSFKKWGFLQTNSIGIIDNSYSSSEDIWMLSVYATRDAVIEVNDRICQFRIVKKQPQVVFTEVDKLDGPVRGGFGSTGSN